MEFSQDQDSDFEIPDFGNSSSDYSEVDEDYRSPNCFIFRIIFILSRLCARFMPIGVHIAHYVHILG